MKILDLAKATRYMWTLWTMIMAAAASSSSPSAISFFFFPGLALLLRPCRSTITPSSSLRPPPLPLFLSSIRSSPPRLRSLSDRGESPISPEDKAKLSLQDLDDQLAQLSQRTLRPIPEPSDQELNEPSELTTPELSTGFLFFVGIGLLLLTVANNLLYHFLLEVPERETLEQETREKMQASQMFSDNDISVDLQP